MPKKRPAAKHADRPAAVIGTKDKPSQPFLWGGGKIYTNHTSEAYRVKKREHHKVDDKVLWRSHGGYKGPWKVALDKIADYDGS